MSTHWTAGPPQAAGDRIDPLEAASKAKRLASYSDRRLIYFLQSLDSEIGLKALTDLILAEYPDRLGTPTMHELGIKPGRVYEREAAAQIERELATDFPDAYRNRGEPREPSEVRCDAFLEECRARAKRELPDLLVKLCTDVRPAGVYDPYGMKLGTDARPSYASDSPTVKVAARWFGDLLGALREFPARYRAAAERDFVMTAEAKKIFEALGYTLTTRAMTETIGPSGAGKTEGVKGFFDQHRGFARLVELKAARNRSAFFADLAKACGIAGSYHLQERVEEFLNLSKLLLIVDEAQHLWPQVQRIRGNPVLVDWVDTACCNRGVPVALVATSEFDRLRRVVEKETNWSSEQFSRRVRRKFELPHKPAPEDVERVARKLLPEGTAAMIKVVVAYAQISKRFYTGVRDIVEDARLIAGDAGRERIALGDIQAAKSVRFHSDAALVRAPAPDSRPRSKRAAVSPPPPCALPADGPQTRRDSPDLTGQDSVRVPYSDALAAGYAERELAEA